MAVLKSNTRPFEPGTTGWTAADLEDPEIERQWVEGSYEIVEGVLTRMPAAFFQGGETLFNLGFLLKTHLKKTRKPGRLAGEVDLILSCFRVVRADAAFLTPEDERRQRVAAKAHGKSDSRRARLYVPPTLVIESVSPGHESHDRVTKRRDYAEFGVPNYWILDSFARTLECLVLLETDYHLDASGKGRAKVRPSLFPGLMIPLGEVWGR